MSAVRDLLHRYQHVISSLTVHAGSKGIFDVTVDGELLFSKHETGRHAEPGEIVELFAQRYAEGVPEYDR